MAGCCRARGGPQSSATPWLSLSPLQTNRQKHDPLSVSPNTTTPHIILGFKAQRGFAGEAEMPRRAGCGGGGGGVGGGGPRLVSSALTSPLPPNRPCQEGPVVVPRVSTPPPRVSMPRCRLCPSRTNRTSQAKPQHGLPPGMGALPLRCARTEARVCSRILARIVLPRTPKTDANKRCIRTDGYGCYYMQYNTPQCRADACWATVSSDRSMLLGFRRAAAAAGVGGDAVVARRRRRTQPTPPLLCLQTHIRLALIEINRSLQNTTSLSPPNDLFSQSFDLPFPPRSLHVSASQEGLEPSILRRDGPPTALTRRGQSGWLLVLILVHSRRKDSSASIKSPVTGLAAPR